MLELRGCFEDMAVLVTQQGELLGQIEFNVNAAGDFVAKGNDNLEKAIVARKKNRKLKCIIIFVLLVIITLVLLPSLGII